MTFISNLTPWPPLLPAPPRGIGWGLVCITPPAIEPLTVTELKNHARIEVSDDDVTRLPRYIRAARAQYERDTNRFVMPQTWDLLLDSVPYRNVPLEIPRPPLQSIVSFTSYDTSNVATLMDPATYIVDVGSEPGRIGLADNASWPQSLRAFQPVKVRFIAGYTGFSRGGGLTAATWANDTAQFTTASAHGFVTGEQVVIAGMTPAGYNGTYEITAVLNATQFAVAIVTDPGPATVLGAVSDLGVPPDDVEAIAMLAGHYYENREASIVSDHRITVETMPIGYDEIVARRKMIYGVE